MKIPFGQAELTLSEKGDITQLTFQGKSVFPENRPAYLIRFFRENAPVEIRSVSLVGQRLTYTFEDIDDTVVVRLIPKEDYTVFDVEICPECFDFLTVGPVVTTLNDMVGDVVGVVQGDNAAIGIQSLNCKTLAGFPHEIDCHNIYKTENPTSSLTVGNLETSDAAAYSMPFGSVLQLFCENRRRDRVKTVWYAENCIPAPSLDREDADIRGCRFALFACSRPDTLSVIGRIELEQGLPHPTLEGEWLKTSRKARLSYLIAEFDSHNIHRMLSYAGKGGFSCLYHPEPFDTWGHFGLRRDQFPHGDRSLKECSQAAEALGIRIGLHTLTNFTKTNDSYVTPVPDKGLKSMAPGVLAGNIGAEDTEFPVRGVGGLACPATLNCLRIGDELVQYEEYESLSQDTFLLKGCVRGAFGTAAESHSQGNPVCKLADYPYRVVFPDIHLQERFSERIAELFNLAGVSQISFDGLEGCEWTGEGEYAINRFCMGCYDRFDHTVLNDASRMHHFLWHMNTRMNWGEPWGEEMRTGQVEGRLRNQEFFRKNLFPGMLGWFLIRKANRKFEASTLTDVEWALSEAAGFDAGFSMTASEDVLDALGNTDELLEAVKNWELLRYENRFEDSLKEQLKKPETEWHLEKIDETLFRLYPKAISKPLVCDLLEMQPGQPGGSDWSFENPFERQEFAFRMKVEGNGAVENPRFYNKSGALQFRTTVKGGQYLLFDGKEACVTDRNYNPLSQAPFSGSCLVEKGGSQLSFGCSFSGEEGPEVRVRVITQAEPYMIRRDDPA